MITPSEVDVDAIIVRFAYWITLSILTECSQHRAGLYLLSWSLNWLLIVIDNIRSNTANTNGYTMLLYFSKTNAIKIWPFSQFSIAGKVHLTNAHAFCCRKLSKSKLGLSVKCFYIQAGSMAMFPSFITDRWKGEISGFASKAQFL